MSSNYSGVPTFSDTLSLMTGSDLKTAQSVRVPLERLLDNTVSLRENTLDGVNGGTYAMTAPLILTGTGPLRVDNIDVEDTIDVRATAELNVLNNADLNVKSGGAINVESSGDINIQSGGDLTIESGGDAEIQSGGALLVDSGGQILIAAEDGLEFNGIAFTWRHSLTPVAVTFSAGVPDWFFNGFQQWVQIPTTANSRITFALNLRPGDTLSTVVIRLNGAISGGAGHAGSLPAVVPVYSLIEVNNVSRTVIATASDGAASAAVYDTAHNTTLSGGSLPLIVDNSSKYYLEVIGESGANAVASTTAVTSVSGTGLARGVRTVNELI